MGTNFRATMLERAIGRVLAEWRRNRGMSLTEACERVGFSCAKLSMMENAIQPSASIEIMALGYIYKVPTPEWQSLTALAKQAAQQRLRPPAELAFDAAIDSAQIHATVVRLRTFQADVIPRILRTQDYTHAVLSADGPLCGKVDAEQHKIANHAWQARLGDKDALTLDAVLHEAAIRQIVDGPRTMNAQLLHLIELSELPNVTIQVVEHNAGAYPAIGSPFTLLSFPHKQHDDVVYVERFLKSQYFEHQHDVARCAERFAALQRIALSPDDSADLIADAASGMAA